MRFLIHIAIGLTILVATTSHTVEAQSKKAQRRSNTAVKNKSPTVRELITAADKGDIGKVVALLDSGVDVNAVFKDGSQLSGRTALMVASLHGYENLVGVLIKRGANVNLKADTGETALLLAMDSEDLKTIEVLVSAGADPNVQVSSFHAGEITPLIRTINANPELRLEMVKILIAAKAEINPTGKFLMSPLMHALEDLEIVKLLISHGADIHQRNFRGATPLMGAAGAGDIAVVRYLIERGADVNARDTDGYTALTYAEERREVFEPQRREEIIQLLKTAQSQPRKN